MNLLTIVLGGAKRKGERVMRGSIVFFPSFIPRHKKHFESCDQITFKLHNRTTDSGWCGECITVSIMKS